MENKISKKILVTGANGMLGSNLIRELLKRGYTINAFVEKRINPFTIKELDVNVIYGDITNYDDVSSAMVGCDYVIHAAANTSVWPKRSEKINKVNIEGTQNIIDGVLQNKIERLIHVSTANAFGFGSKQDLGNEMKPSKSEKYKLDYMDSKHKAQQLVLKNVKEKNLPAIIVNPTFMIGAFDSGPSSGKMILSLYQKKIPGYTLGGKNYINVKDVVIAISNSLTQGRIGECYILGNQNLSFKDAFGIIAETIGVDKPTLKLHTPFACLYGLLCDGIATISKRTPQVSYNLSRIACDEHYYSSEKAKRELGLPQTDIRYGIRECLQWFKDNGYITQVSKKVAIVTGSTMGIGKALALELLKQNYDVVINGRDIQKLQKTKADFLDLGFEVLSIQADVTVFDDCQKLIQQTIHQYGRVDVLVNNAGVAMDETFERSNPEILKNVLDSNILGAVFPSKAILPYIKESKGSIVFISSIAGVFGMPSASGYSAGKMALTALAQSLKIELNSSGIHIGLVYVSFTENDIEKKLISANSVLVPVPKRPKILLKTQQQVALAIIKNIKTRKFKSVISFFGKTVFIGAKLMPSFLLYFLSIYNNKKIEKANLTMNSNMDLSPLNQMKNDLTTT